MAVVLLHGGGRRGEGGGGEEAHLFPVVVLFLRGEAAVASHQGVERPRVSFVKFRAAR